MKHTAPLAFLVLAFPLVAFARQEEEKTQDEKKPTNSVTAFFEGEAVEVTAILIR